MALKHWFKPHRGWERKHGNCSKQMRTVHQMSLMVCDISPICPIRPLLSAMQNRVMNHGVNWQWRHRVWARIPSASWSWWFIMENPLCNKPPCYQEGRYPCMCAHVCVCVCICVCECRKQAAQCKDGEGQEGRKEILLEKCPRRQKPKNPLQCNNPPEGIFTLTETAALSISHRPDETITMAKRTFLWLIQDLYQTRKQLSVVVSQKGKNWHSFHSRTKNV